MQNDEYGELMAAHGPLPIGNLMNRLILCGLAIFGFVTVVAPTNVDGQTRQAFERDRNRMVDQEIVDAGIKNPRVIEAMRRTPRHEFMPLSQRKYAYLDMALPIGDGQTISPPFVVAYMTEQLAPSPPTRSWRSAPAAATRRPC